jgi:TPR repeat protein
VVVVNWYEKAGEQDHARAYWNVGMCYEFGTGVEKDEAVSADWCRRPHSRSHAS